MFCFLIHFDFLLRYLPWAFLQVRFYEIKVMEPQLLYKYKFTVEFVVQGEC